MLPGREERRIVRTDLAKADSTPGVGSHVRAWCLAQRWLPFLWSWMALWALVMFERIRVNHANFNTARFDLGNMVQAVWSTAQGRPLEVTNEAGDQILRLAGHVDPILALIAPLWILVPSPMTLVAVQVGALALGAIPVYWLGRKNLASESTAALLALVYLTYPWLAWSAIDAIHPVTLAIPFLLLAIWFLDNDRLWPFALVAVGALACGELIGLAVAALGLWYAFARGRRRAGLVIALLGTAWSVIAVMLVIPALRDGPSQFAGYYSSVGGSPEAILRTAVTDPLKILAEVVTAQDLAYILLLAAPLGAAFLLAPGLAAVVLPQLFLNTLSDRAALVDPRYHYVAAIVPFLIGATVLGLRRVPEARQKLAAALILIVSIVMFVLAGPWPGTNFADRTRFPSTYAPHVAAMKDAVSLIPDDARLMSTNVAGAHLSERRYFYNFPVLADAEWVLVETRDSWVPPGTPGGDGVRPALMRSLLAQLDRDPRWTKVFDREDVLVFRRAVGG